MPYVTVQGELPWQSGSETSHAAAIQSATFAATQRQKLLAWFQSKGASGGTDAEAEVQLLLKRQSICARRNELIADGLVGWTDERRGGCTVWRCRG